MSVRARRSAAPHAAADWSSLREHGTQRRAHLSPRATLILGDSLEWLQTAPPRSIHAVVTDPPYGILEYEPKDHAKLRAGRGGLWRIPPAFDGARRRPLPRFTVLSTGDLESLDRFFFELARALRPVLVPGAHVFMASNPLVSSVAFHAMQRAGLEKRGEIIRLTQTLRGGDRPKGAEREFAEVSMMARSAYEPWGIFRNPLAGTGAENLRCWGTGGLRRISGGQPFKDVIECAPTRARERRIAPHPSLKPQRFVRRLVRAALPLGTGILYDPFAGSGSTLAAAEALGCLAVGGERDAEYFAMARAAFTQLAAVRVDW